MSDVARGRDDAAPPSAPNTIPRAPGQFARLGAKVVPWAACGLLVVAVCAVYGRSLEAPFIFDDYTTIVDNPSIQQLYPLFGGPPGTSPLSAARGKPTAGRPLVNLSLAVNYAIAGTNPFGYHVCNLVIHILAAILLWAILRRSLRLEYFKGRFDRAAEPLAFFVALAWALHPLVTETVQYVTQRTELMMGMFYLATMYASLRYFTATVPSKKTAWCVSAAVACLLGMACKEMMVTAPVMVLCFERTFIAGSFRKALERSWRLYLGLAFGWLLLLALNYDAPRAQSAGFRDDVPFYAYWLMQAKVLEMYLKLAFWPWPLVIHYEIPIILTPVTVWPSLLVVAVLVVNTVMRFWQRKTTGYLGAWFFIVLSPTLVVPMFLEAAAERRMYLPLAGIVVLVIVGGYALLQSAALRRQPEVAAKKTTLWPLAITGGCALIVAVVFGIVSAHRLTAYNSRLALWEDAFVHQPDNFMVLTNFGCALLLAGREQEANEYLNRALAKNPAAVQHHWGNTLMLAGRRPEAVEHLEEAARHDPDSARVRRDLAIALVHSGRSREAIKQLELAIRLEPDFANNHRFLGVALVNVGRPQEAIPHLKQALRLRPNAADVEQYLATAIVNARRTAESIERLRKAVQNQPDSAQLHFDLGTALFENGQLDEAIAKFEQALRLQAEFPAAKLKLEQAVEARRQ